MSVRSVISISRANKLFPLLINPWPYIGITLIFLTSRKNSMHALTFSPDISSPRYSDISPNSTEQRTTVGEHSAKYTKMKKCRRLIGDTSTTLPTTSCKHRRCILDVIISPMVWVIHRRYSPMFPNCSAKHQRCSDEASLSVRKAVNFITSFSLHLYTPAEQKVISSSSTISFGGHVICGSTWNLFTFYMFFTRHYTIAMTSSR